MTLAPLLGVALSTTLVTAMSAEGATVMGAEAELLPAVGSNSVSAVLLAVLVITPVAVVVVPVDDAVVAVDAVVVLADVDVVVDDRGVPHVFAQSEEDAWRAQGFLLARDRLFQILDRIFRRFCIGK